MNKSFCHNCTIHRQKLIIGDGLFIKIILKYIYVNNIFYYIYYTVMGRMNGYDILKNHAVMR